MTSMTWGRQKHLLHNVFVTHPPPSWLLLPLSPSPDAVIDPWLRQLWEKLLFLYPLPPGVEPISDSVLYPLVM